VLLWCDSIWFGYLFKCWTSYIARSVNVNVNANTNMNTNTNTNTNTNVDDRFMQMRDIVFAGNVNYTTEIAS
jgi:hypothetical protein